MTPELAARYAETFAACWRETQPERFLDCFCASMTPQIRLEQPLVPTSTGHEAFRREFGRLRRFVPDLRGELRHWAWSGDYLYLELDLSGSLGKRRVSWRLIDRLQLDEQGLCAERVSFFDPLPLLLRIMLTPSCWGRLLVSGMLPALLRALRPTPLEAL